LIPFVALGGMVPIMLGAGGWGGCLAVSRARFLPVVLRLLVCLGITLGCWFLFVAMLAALGTFNKR
jgi:hypothetical protein